MKLLRDKSLCSPDSVSYIDPWSCQPCFYRTELTHWDLMLFFRTDVNYTMIICVSCFLSRSNI